MAAATISMLDDALINQIAAGEVVDRPASVVKELVENAIDAAAKSIRIELRDGGRQAISVIDDGVGMNRRDAELCVMRHATSKISTFDDLSRLKTLGFRGEALASIASVSSFRLRTSNTGDGNGTELRMEADALPQIQETNYAQGTRVDVDDLFFNVPARRKFLKARQTELNQVLEQSLRQVLARPDLALQIHHEGRLLRQYLSVASMKERVAQVYRNLELNLIEWERGQLRCEAWLAPVESSRAGHKQLHFYVNDRAIDDYRLARALAFAYGAALAPGHYPLGVVRLWLDPREVDVNVHPQKTEIRFARAFEIYDTLSKTFARHLGNELGLASIGTSFWQNALARPNPEPTLIEEVRVAYGSGALTSFHTNQDSSVNTPRLRVLAQSRNLFLVCEDANGLCVIDYHAMHEHVLFEALREQHQNQSVEKQSLLFAERASLSESELQHFHNNAALFTALGFELTQIAKHEVAIHAIPCLLQQADVQLLVSEILRTLREEPALANSPELLEKLLGRLACRAAHKSGMRIDLAEAQERVNRLDALKGAHPNCPHSQIVVANWRFENLERRLNS